MSALRRVTSRSVSWVLLTRCTVVKSPSTQGFILFEEDKITGESNNLNKMNIKCKIICKILFPSQDGIGHITFFWRVSHQNNSFFFSQGTYEKEH